MFGVLPGRRADSTRKAAALRTLPGFAALADRDLARLAVVFDEVRVAPGTVLARAGQASHELILLVEGAATATNEQTGARTTLGRGHCVGDVAMLGHGAATATVVAETEARVLVAGPRTARTALAHPTVLRHVAAGLADQLLDPPATVAGRVAS